MNALSMLQQGDVGLEQQRERKFLPDAAAAQALWALASCYLRPEHGSSEVAYSRTTYFDTPDLSYYRSCCGPVKRRLRVREYALPSEPDAPPVLADSCFLELKQSAGNMRTKTRLALHPGDVAAQLQALTDAPLAPCVATLYRRRALVDNTGALRVTLDDRLTLCKPQPIGTPLSALQSSDILASGPSFVLEYKACGNPPTWLVRGLSGLDEAVGFSKFMLGMNAVARAGMAARPTLRSIAMR